MKIRDLYQRNIDRHIDPAVVVGKTDSATVEAEIEEYVFTEGLIGNLYKVLNAISQQKNGKTGIWINGYYGSGKSHFIKYLHYLLQHDTSELAFKRLIHHADRLVQVGDPATSNNLALLQKKLATYQVEDDLFNIEDITDDNEHEKLTRILLRRLCRLRGLNSAHIPLALTLERRLQKKGLLDAFIERMKKEHNHDWRGSELEITVLECDTVVKLAHSLDPDIDMESTRSFLENPDQYDITIEHTLIPQLKDFLSEKGESYRLLFLIDEVSQYIGADQELLLNLQNIVERVSNLNGQVWIACTAQQALDEVIRNTGIQASIEDQFGKILGRFDTKISLESQDAAYITQKRVLHKNTESEKALALMYREQKDAMTSQFRLPHALYKGYETEESFTMAYPFVPYQFRLISEVFDAFSQKDFVIKQVKNNERSILSVTHFAAKEHADLEVGRFIPFDAFFNGLMRENLTHHATRALSNPLNLDYVKNGKFELRVVYALFMLSNLTNRVSPNFPPTIENLALLLVRALDDSLLEIQHNLKKVLDRLIDDNVAYRDTNGRYYFYTEDEMEVQAQIRNTTINLDDRLTFFVELLNDVLQLRKKISYKNTGFALQLWVDDKRVFPQGDIEIDLSVMDTSGIDERALNNSKRKLIICLGEILMKHPEFRPRSEVAIQTGKYFKSHGVNGSDTRRNTVEKMRVRQKERINELKLILQKVLLECRFISGQHVYQAAEVTAANVQDRYQKIVEFHISRLYDRYDLVQAYAQNENVLKDKARNPQVPAITDLTPAEKQVDQLIQGRGGTLSVEEIFQVFQDVPYGWPDAAIIDVLIQLSLKDRRQLNHRNENRITPDQFAAKALSRAERPALVVKPTAAINPETVRETAEVFYQIFQVRLNQTSEAGRLSDEIDEKIAQIRKEYEPLITEYYDQGHYRFARYFYDLHDRLGEIRNASDASRKFDLLTQHSDDLKSIFDGAKENRELVESRFTQYRNLSSFYETNKNVIDELGSEAQAFLDTIRNFLNADRPLPDLRHAIRAMQEVKDRLATRLNTTRSELQAIAEDLFREIGAVAENDGVDPGFLLTEEEELYQAIGNTHSLTELRLMQYGLDSKRVELLKLVAGEAAKQNGEVSGEDLPVIEEYRISAKSRTIRNEQELEQFIGNIRTELLQLLKENKQIIVH